MSEEPLDRIVLRYLQKRGHGRGARAQDRGENLERRRMALVPRRAPTRASPTGSSTTTSGQRPRGSRGRVPLLREWTHNSLDLYKVRAICTQSLRVAIHARAPWRNGRASARDRTRHPLPRGATPSALVRRDRARSLTALSPLVLPRTRKKTRTAARAPARAVSDARVLPPRARRGGRPRASGGVPPPFGRPSLAHGEEVVALAGLASPAHLRSDPTAAKLRQNRMPVRCCQYARSTCW